MILLIFPGYVPENVSLQIQEISAEKFQVILCTGFQQIMIYILFLNLPAVNISALSTEADRNAILIRWLLNGNSQITDPLTDFLKRLNEFNLNEYIKTIRFDELKVPSIPFQLPGSRTYHGLQEIMDSELDFLKATVLSKSEESVIMYSDMPMEEMAKDPDFPKKWMFGMAMMLKKGLL